jgi:hypothetical protein
VKSPEIPDRELTFGETVIARSDALLNKGKPQGVNGEERLVYEWTTYHNIRRKFTLNRPVVPTVGPNTVYRLKFEELDPRDGHGGHCDFSQAQGIHYDTSEGLVDPAYDESTARGKNMTVPELHEWIVLDMLATEPLKDTGF